MKKVKSDKVDLAPQTAALDASGKPYNRGLMMALILVATFAAMLNQTTLATAIPTLMKDFNVSLSTAQQATTWFLLANGVMIPVTAYLTLKFKTKWLYLVAYAMIFVGSLVLVTTPTTNYSIFIVGRVLQAMGAGITMPLLQVVIVEIYPPERRGRVMGLAGLAFGIAPAVGPTFSGWVLDAPHSFFGWTLAAGWRSVFFVPMVVVGICLLFAPFLLKNVLSNREVHLDFLSLTSSVLGFGAFLWGFTNVATDGWGDLKTVILPILIGLLIIAFFVWRQLHMETPFLDMRVFKNKQFTVATIAASVVTMAMMGVEMMLPVYLQDVRGLTPLNSGLTLLPGSLLMGAVMPLAGAIYDKIGAKRLAFVGFIMLAIGTYPFMFLNLMTPEHFITTVYGLRMVAVAMIMMSMITSAMNALPRDEIAHGTSSNNTVRMIASSVVVALLSSVTQNVQQSNAPAASLQAQNVLKYTSEFLESALKGFRVSFTLAFAFCLLGIGVAFFLRSRKIVNMAESFEEDVKVETEVAQA